MNVLVCHSETDLFQLAVGNSALKNRIIDLENEQSSLEKLLDNAYFTKWSLSKKTEDLVIKHFQLVETYDSFLSKPPLQEGGVSMQKVHEIIPQLKRLKELCIATQQQEGALALQKIKEIETILQPPLSSSTITSPRTLPPMNLTRLVTARQFLESRKTFLEKENKELEDNLIFIKKIMKDNLGRIEELKNSKIFELNTRRTIIEEIFRTEKSILDTVLQGANELISKRFPPVKSDSQPLIEHHQRGAVKMTHKKDLPTRARSASVM